MDTFRERLNLRTYRESLNTSACDNEMLDEGSIFVLFLQGSINLPNLWKLKVFLFTSDYSVHLYSFFFLY